jgi:hypothetical protein
LETMRIKVITMAAIINGIMFSSLIDCSVGFDNCDEGFDAFNAVHFY